MTEAPDQHDTESKRVESGDEAFRYPTNHVVAVLDDSSTNSAAVAALGAGGFLPSEIQVATGAAAGDALDATTGRRGLASLLIRFAERIGATNEEIETKNRYEQAMRENRFVVAVATPTAARKAQATQILGLSVGQPNRELGTDGAKLRDRLRPASRSSAPSATVAAPGTI